MTRRRFLVSLAALSMGVVLPAFASQRTPAREIELLIERVGASKGVIFLRNGSEHAAVDAAQHLRRKLAATKGRIRTPEQFIDKLGSRSSMTGRAYRVRLADGRELESADWMHQLLRDIRAGR